MDGSQLLAIGNLGGHWLFLPALLSIAQVVMSLSLQTLMVLLKVTMVMLIKYIEYTFSHAGAGLSRLHE